jgi:hypothetical protein
MNKRIEKKLARLRVARTAEEVGAVIKADADRAAKRLARNARRYAADIPDGYGLGLGRSDPPPRIAHLYKLEGGPMDFGLPMCPAGWNRDDGESYSVWRNNNGRDGVCLRCLARAKKRLDGVPSKYPEEADE